MATRRPRREKPHTPPAAVLTAPWQRHKLAALVLMGNQQVAEWIGMAVSAYQVLPQQMPDTQGAEPSAPDVSAVRDGTP